MSDDANLGCGVDHAFELAAQGAAVVVDHQDGLLARGLVVVGQRIEKRVEHDAAKHRQDDGVAGKNGLEFGFEDLPPGHAGTFPPVGDTSSSVGSTANPCTFRRANSMGTMNNSKAP